MMTMEEAIKRDVERQNTDWKEKVQKDHEKNPFLKKVWIRRMQELFKN